MAESKIKNALYNAAQWSWGLPQTLAGAVLYARHRHDPHFNYNGARVTAWNRNSGVSLGKFIFVPAEKDLSAMNAASDKDDKGKDKADGKRPAKVSRFLLDHEYGHTIQSLMLGPAYLLLVGLPSFAWNRLDYFERKRRQTGKSYYSAIFERTASELGERVSEKSEAAGRQR